MPMSGHAASALPLVIFDCDGVLVDSEALVVAIEAELLAEVGIHLTVPEVVETFVGLSEAAMTALIAERWGVVLDADFETRKTAQIVEAFESSLQPIPGIDTLLVALPHRRCV